MGRRRKRRPFCLNIGSSLRDKAADFDPDEGDNEAAVCLELGAAVWPALN